MIDRPRRPGDPPNVVLIGIDTLRADAVSSYGAARPTTPHLDRLAAEGVRFADVTTVAPWTVPSFASIFTGLMPSRHGAIDRLTPLAPELTTLAERLRDAGWRTHAVAYKAFLYNLGFDQGFDDWLNVPRLDRTAEDVAARAIEVLERHHDRRFFLFLHFDDPHQPMRPPAAFGRRFVAVGALEHFEIALPYDFKWWPGVGCRGCRPDPESGPDYRELTRAVYDGAVAFTDDRIGAFLAALRARGVYDDTLIAVVSDHGETLWDRGGDFGHGHSKQEVLRAVMMIKPQRSSRLRPGTVVASRVRTTDLAPTVLDLVGLDPGPPGPDSHSLVPLTRGEAAGPPVVVAENPRVRTIAVRRGDWKYVTRFGPGLAPREELYDLAGDPAERTNVATQQPAPLAELRGDLLDHVLRNRGGTYLVALGEGGPRPWEIEIAAAGRDLLVQSLAGLAPQPGAGGRRILGGSAEGRLLALVELAGARDGPIEARLRADGAEVARLSAARATPLPRDFSATALLRRAGPALHLLTVPPGAHAPPPAAESAENLEQLRALGYIE